MNPSPQVPSRRWIHSATFDGFFFFASGPIAIAVGAILLQWPAWLLPCWVAFLWLIDGPHLLATFWRSYTDKISWQHHRSLLLGSLLWIVAPVIWIAMGLWLKREEPLQLLLAVSAVWSYWHVVRQHHGVLGIYQRFANTSVAEAKRDSRQLQWLLWLAFFSFLLAHPLNRAELSLPTASAAACETGALMLVLLQVVLLLSMMISLWRRHKAQQDIRPSVFALVVVATTVLFSFYVVGMQEPLLAKPMTVEMAFLATAIVGGLIHGLQYIGIVVATNGRRARTQDPLTGWARLNQAPMMAYLLMLILTAGYVYLNYVRGAFPFSEWPVVDVLSSQAQLALAFYWGLFFHHYWLDQAIWHPSYDVRLREELGLVDGAA